MVTIWRLLYTLVVIQFSSKVKFSNELAEVPCFYEAHTVDQLIQETKFMWYGHDIYPGTRDFTLSVVHFSWN